MRVSFVSQGLTVQGNSAGKVILESFAEPTFTKFSCLVAFVSVSGIHGLSDAIRDSQRHISQFDVIVGIDQKATSKESLEELLNLGINTKIYYTDSPIIFHPKIYVFDSPTKCRIIIGSSNLTQAGLFQNIEASVVIDFDRPDAQGEGILSQISTYFSDLFSSRDSNIKPLSNILIKELSDAGIIPDRAETEEIRKQIEINASARTSGQAEARVKALFPTISIQRLPSGFRRRTRSRQTIITPQPYNVVNGRQTFLMQLNRYSKGTPGEFRIPIAARDAAPQLWGWPSEYTRTERNRGSKTREYFEWKPVWSIIYQQQSTSENVRIYLYSDSMDFRMYSNALLRFGAAEGDIVKISRGDSHSNFVFRCELIKRGTQEYDSLIQFCTQRVRNSNRKYGFI